MSGRRLRALSLVAIMCAMCPGVCAAQAAPPEGEAVRRVVEEAAAKGLPSAPLTSKVQEGLAKGVDPKRIEIVVRQMATNLETADRLVREIDPAAQGVDRDTSVSLLAESFGSGLTPDEVRELRRVASSNASTGQPALSAPAIANAAKGLSLIKDARLPVAEGTAVVAEAMKQRFRAYEILDLGREVKRRENDYRSGRANLRALREAIARGDRPDQLFRDSRTDAVERPAATRPQPPVERPATRPETPPRPEQPVRPERPGR